MSAPAKHHRVLVGIGSNIDPEINLVRAVQKLEERTVLEKVSNVYQTPPVGGSGEDFLNAAALISTTLSANELKEKILNAIENELGRVRTEDPNAPRTIDLDILIYDGVVLDEMIWIFPHLCVPSAELLPEIRLSGSEISLGTRAQQLAKDHSVKKHPLNLHWSSAP